MRIKIIHNNAALNLSAGMEMNAEEEGRGVRIKFGHGSRWIHKDLYHVLPEPPKEISKLVLAALMMDKLSIKYHVQMTPAQAIAFLSQADAYNNFTQRDLVNLIEKINSLVPVMNYGTTNGYSNPNNGKTFHTFSIGNEGSRVIYLNVVKAYINKDKNTVIDNIINGVTIAAKQHHADEVSTEENSPHFLKMRFWWD